ncbi:MAG: MbcA/ParS/Xre antitoxin family protein [Polaromonas sp.]|uniref:MbcA/ParS/Xre antitoxin family protein n=1 Tax=Polaromonas sp. TaxID=1869339 RepID=UPI0024880FE5|nr:MbcA/ParS/Xre antitoxin family protein [Polaromonas sp.]MDI1269255.1 MbcA/ParS/Xre antitoxin family protein [Polaromonas sp.]
MSRRKRKRIVGQLFHSRFLWQFSEEQEWLNMAQVGHEFGSSDYDRLMQLDFKVRVLAVEELGSIAAAEQWLMAPAMGLDQRRPVDLMQTIDGIAQVAQLLLRMRYGVYV